MKIALVVPGFSRDAGEWAIPSLQSLACYLARVHEVHVFSLRYPAAGQYRFCGLIHHALGGGTRSGLSGLPILARAVRAVVAEHRRAPFDVLHAFWVDEPALVAVFAGRRLRRPVLASVGGGELVHLPEIAYGTWASRWRRQMIRHALNGANAITAGSAYMRMACLERGVPSQKVTVAPLGVNGRRFQPAPLPSLDSPWLVQAASLSPVKNQALLLEVFAGVRNALPDARLLLAGQGPLKQSLAQQAARQRLSEHITWLGAVSHSQMAAVYRRAHVYVQSSLHESQAMAVLEAMACGRPALGTPVGLLPEVAAAPPTWHAVDLVEQAVALLQDGARLSAMGQAAQLTAHGDFSLEGAAARFINLYEGL